jgi:hypothetical protein
VEGSRCLQLRAALGLRWCLRCI